MEKKKPKFSISTEKEGLDFVFKTHALSRKEKEKHAARNYAYRLLKDENQLQKLATAFFQHLPAQQVAKFEEQYPVTTQRLFLIAEQLLAGKFGDHYQDQAKKLATEIFHPDTMKKLLTKDSEQNQLSQENIPELLAKEWSRSEILAVEQLLRKYLSNLLSLSHVSVDLMIEHYEPIEKSVEIAEKIQNPLEKSKSIASIVKELIHTNRFREAIETAKTFQVNKQVNQPLAKMIDQTLNPNRPELEKMLYGNRLNETLAYIKTIENEVRRNKMYQKIAQTLAKQQRLDEAQKVVLLITEQETQEYTMSTLVSTLAGLESFQEAIYLAREIHDAEYREDAFSYIVKSYLIHEQIDNAIAFVESIQNVSQRAKAAKILLSSMIAHHDPEREIQIREKFELAR